MSGMLQIGTQIDWIWTHSWLKLEWCSKSIVNVLTNNEKLDLRSSLTTMKCFVIFNFSKWEYWIALLKYIPSTNTQNIVYSHIKKTKFKEPNILLFPSVSLAEGTDHRDTHREMQCCPEGYNYWMYQSHFIKLKTSGEGK